MDKAKNILTSIVGILMLAFFSFLLYKEKIIWWHLLCLMVGLGVFLVFYFNFDRIEELLLEYRKSKVFIKMARERIEKVRKELDVLRERPKAKPKVSGVAEEKGYRAKPREFISSPIVHTELLNIINDVDLLMNETETLLYGKSKAKSSARGELTVTGKEKK